uniref:60S ribosomal protein L34 n=1 Tax=Fibrocapsa japonica TaxID=94617 RepID=A0A7S2UXI2_9STRA|mmetsp:Transcript_19039/g.27470  ORF Transcript_19039/g.27470 Transcript_19039/m.27470 type:complete len:119 (+) Transcript_19039:108-464(+)|eukprot:CAMPEP_0113935258 /NCGR_PEP_ID=MMETSP1339-20121228/2421_1 /TAXON_ID=94617 /ORGANISM="Fibrocapsa japonica" /LENGTH=118 /DNA_ID=CAMNT_0000937331 /DNA_START=106 /DNA_END=462 /DNA_ORIENTATION=- /assembly_acc=CAM_ASM_000762
MVKDIRVQYRRRHSYATKSNKIKIVKTPGGRLVAHYHTKKAKGPKCAECGISLPGIKHVRPIKYKNMKKREKTVTRAYGGSECGKCVKDRIVRAFLIEEQKIVKKMVAEKLKKKKPSA